MSIFPNTFIYGDSNVKNGITDLRDVGRYVARIIHDERTLNKFVYFFGDETSQEENFKLLEELSGEKITPQYVCILSTSSLLLRCNTDMLNEKVPKEELESSISSLKEKLTEGDVTPLTRIKLHQTEYNYSKFVRGDNTHQYAKYLGYLNAGELYPDFKPVAWRDFLKDLLDGKISRPYPEGLAGFSI